jgi:N-methylhydantoinase A
MILGIDVGGTFTDFCLSDDAGRVSIHKLLTSARDPSLAILQGIRDLEAGPETSVVHGATVATNALLERRGARTALITTEGFRDVLEIGRQTRPDLYALHPTRPEPLVPSHWRFELPERLVPDRRGDGGDPDRRAAVLVPLDGGAADCAVRRILEEGIESVAICFLFSFLDPSHERLVRDRIFALGGDGAPFVSLSSEVLPEYREYERTAATVINAYVAPLVGQYLANLETGLEGRRLRIMQSNGGSISAEAARTLAARTALSGPAGGVVGAFELSRMAGFDQVITFDMGGTSTDVSLCPGQVQETAEGEIAGLPLRLPLLDIHTVGAGGGSIARLDEGGALRVGPESAGADPGPVCYGQAGATRVTVTDANLLLGRLEPNHFLGGRMKLDQVRCQARMQDLARQSSLPPEAVAWGILRVASSNMERAIRTISVERGYDPRAFTLTAFGGAGPLHACELAAALGIPRILIPPHPGVLSALGMVLADLVKDYSQTVMLPAEMNAAPRVEALFRPLCERALSELRTEGLGDGEIALLPALDMRYAGQSFELPIPLLQVASAWRRDGCLPTVDISRAIQDFHAAHLRRFSYASEGERVEIVNLRLKAVGHTAKPVFARNPLGRVDPKAAQIGYRLVHFSDPEHPNAARPIPSALYERERLTSGNIVVGPAIIVQLDSTTVVPPGWAASVDVWLNLVVRRSGA